jgi:hypothetical protein
VCFAGGVKPPAGVSSSSKGRHLALPAAPSSRRSDGGLGRIEMSGWAPAARDFNRGIDALPSGLALPPTSALCLGMICRLQQRRAQQVDVRARELSLR